MKHYLLFWMLAWPSATALAQTDMVASGGNGSDVGGSVNFTIGQVFYQQNTSEAGTENQGVQQPYEISIITDVENSQLTDVQLQVYPNPTTDRIIIRTIGQLDEELTVQLFNTLGQELSSTKLASTDIEIPMQALAAATYHLVIRNNRSEQKTYKIIKR
jgi:hypothetical protein